jgi:outer membrane protein OmpA-like peptidoglycan-associated protein
VPDAQDKCPDKQETINGVQDEDGCPDKGESWSSHREEIKILQQVFFDTNKDTIKPKSFNLLNQVAQILKAHPEVKKIEIQGHTDDVGEDKANDVLSNGRANSVRKYLIEKGVDGARLTPKGYGESKPIKPGKSAAARAPTTAASSS